MNSLINSLPKAYLDHEQAKNYQSWAELLELVKNQENVIRQQNDQMCKIEKEMKELKENCSRKREKQLF